MKVAQSCLTLCKPMDYTVHGILQARILEWVASSNPGIEPRSPTLQADSLPTELSGMSIEVTSNFLLLQTVLPQAILSNVPVAYGRKKDSKQWISTFSTYQNCLGNLKCLRVRLHLAQLHPHCWRCEAGTHLYIVKAPSDNPSVPPAWTPIALG